MLYCFTVTGIKMNDLTLGSLLNPFHSATEESKYELDINTGCLEKNLTTHLIHAAIPMHSH